MASCLDVDLDNPNSLILVVCVQTLNKPKTHKHDFMYLERFSTTPFCFSSASTIGQLANFIFLGNGDVIDVKLTGGDKANINRFTSHLLKGLTDIDTCD